MKRDVKGLADGEFDLLVVGGGMFGACIAQAAALRGYAVALVEKGDFAHATSSNHYKFIHGGIRYLQHADIARLRESSRERSALVRIAPHLAYPMPIVLPTYGHGRKGRLFMRAGMLAYDVLTADRNRGISDLRRRVPNGSFLSREETLQKFPGIATDGLTGAAIVYDGQMYNPARLVLAFLHSATAHGAIVANYMEATSFIQNGSRVQGCLVTDRLSGRESEIRARVTVNAAGPWAAQLLPEPVRDAMPTQPEFSRDLAIVVNRSLCATHALACQAISRDSDALLDRGARHVFLVPWRGNTLVGVWHRYSRASPERLTVSREELASFLSEINSAYTSLNLTLEDIRFINTGLILFGSEKEQASGSDHSFSKRSLVVDHAEQGTDGLITVVGARATVARGVAERILKLVDRKARRSGRTDLSAWRTIHGGDFSDFEELVQEVQSSLPGGAEGVARAVAHNYGTAYRDLLAAAPDTRCLGSIADTNVLKAEVVHAVSNEMATSLADIVLRRTELGSAGNPGEEAVAVAADIAARELGWDAATRDAELQHVCELLRKGGPWHLVARNDEIPAGE